MKINKKFVTLTICKDNNSKLLSQKKKKKTICKDVVK